MALKLPLAEAIARYKTVHGETYDYSELVPHAQRDYIYLSCSKHGLFIVRAICHGKGRGCPICDRVVQKEIERIAKFNQFVALANQVHAAKYLYKSADFSRRDHLITIICPTHGEFSLNGDRHLAGTGCPVCRSEAKASQQVNQFNKFIALATSVHGGHYTYELNPFFKGDKRVFVICPSHGKFSQRRDKHLKGQGCVACNHIAKRPSSSSHKRKFIQALEQKYGNRITLADRFTSLDSPVLLNCYIHGEFKANPKEVLKGRHSCPECDYSMPPPVENTVLEELTKARQTNPILRFLTAATGVANDHI